MRRVHSAQRGVPGLRLTTAEAQEDEHHHPRPAVPRRVSARRVRTAAGCSPRPTATRPPRDVTGGQCQDRDPVAREKQVPKAGGSATLAARRPPGGDQAGTARPAAHTSRVSRRAVVRWRKVGRPATCKGPAPPHEREARARQPGRNLDVPKEPYARNDQQPAPQRRQAGPWPRSGRPIPRVKATGTDS